MTSSESYQMLFSQPRLAWLPVILTSVLCSLVISHSPSLVFSFFIETTLEKSKFKREKEMGNIFRRKATATLGT